MTLSEIHIKWKHFKTLLPVELNVRSETNIPEYWSQVRSIDNTCEPRE